MPHGYLPLNMARPFFASLHDCASCTMIACSLGPPRFVMNDQLTQLVILISGGQRKVKSDMKFEAARSRSILLITWSAILFKLRHNDMCNMGYHIPLLSYVISLYLNYFFIETPSLLITETTIIVFTLKALISQVLHT